MKDRLRLQIAVEVSSLAGRESARVSRKKGRRAARMETEPLRKRLLSGDKDFSKEDQETVCHWVKQCVALGLGVGCGIAPVTGLTGFVAFGSTAVFACWFFYAKVMRAELDFEAQLELWKEGATAAFALFVLTWTVAFTLAHPQS